MPIAQFANLAPSQVFVSSFYIGANAQTVESAVTIPLEQAINGVQGMKYMTSTSGNDGSSAITITFDISRDVDLASVDVQNRVNQALGRLPSEVKNTGIFVNKQASGFVFGAGVYTEGGQYDSLFLSNYMDVYVRDAIKRVPGVADAIIFGERKYAMRLWLDPSKMAQRGLTATNILAALQEQNVQVAAGQIGQPPTPSGQTFQMRVRAIVRLSEASEFDNMSLKTGADGTLVRVKDVGRGELGAEDYSSRLRYNGHEAVGMGVTQLPGANALDVDKAAKAEFLRLSKNFPPGLKYAVAFDTTNVVSESIRDVLITLLQAIALVIAVIFLFLQDWRSTFIPAITIPVSLVGTFIFIKAFGFSINTLTLFGITLATGLVVDDAIVVIENVERHIAEGITEQHNAASVAMREVAGAVVATSLVLVAVFIPAALFPGTDGRVMLEGKGNGGVAAANHPEGGGVFSIGGFSFSRSGPIRAIVFIPLKPWRDHAGAEHTAGAVLGRLRGPLMGIPEALVIPFNPPAIQGLGQFGGFQFVLEDQGRNTLQALANTANQLAAQSRTSPDLAGLFTSFTANDPQYLVHIDREKAKSLQVPLNQITNALQVYMGSVYVNDFDFNNRAYRVYVQADQKFRAKAKDIAQYYLRDVFGFGAKL